MKALIAALLIAVAVGCARADAHWREVWSDDFERAELGSGWKAPASARIQSGKLLLTGGGATAFINRQFGANVRVEMVAEADPSMEPCDLSIGLGSSEVHGYQYLLAFGGQNNQVNQILGPGVEKIDKKPHTLIETGRRYRVAAELRGEVLKLEVDGVKLVEAQVDGEVMVGPGLDRVALVTWAGMLVDEVRVFEPEQTPEGPGVDMSQMQGLPMLRLGNKIMNLWSPFAPGLAEGVDALEQGRTQDAMRIFRALEKFNSYLSLTGRAMVLGDLAYQEATDGSDLKAFAQDTAAASARDPDTAPLAALAQAARWFARLRMDRSGLPAAVRLTALGPQGNPFYYKARLYEARYLYWNGMEGGNQQQISRAREMMSELKMLWPNNTVLRQYTGESVPWGGELIADPAAHPEWAAYLREAYARQVRLMEVWFDRRQAADGQLGGGWGDDVELMRTWMQIAAISTAADKARAGIEKLAEGVWQNELQDGYSRNVGDVEHSAEPSADTLPGMLLLRYGDPLWLERNLISCRTIKERFMGIDERGFPRFYSSEFGAEGVNTNPRAGGDTGYHARAMKHFLWQGWWGDTEALDWFVRWADGWRAATEFATDGKLAGMPPASIWYPSGKITPPTGSNWWAQQWNYYGNMGTMAFDSMLAAAALSGEGKFLQTFNHFMTGATTGPLPHNPTPGTAEDQLLQMAHMATPNLTSLYRWLTGERTYDEYTLRTPEPIQRYRANGDLPELMGSFKKTAESMRDNLELQTTEVLSTDRAALPGALTVFGAYTGAVQGLRDASTPTFAVTYDTPHTDFAALVVDSSARRLRVWLYNFRDEPMRVGLVCWLLKAGVYRLQTGQQLPGERQGQFRYAWTRDKDVRHLHRADTHYVVAPSRQVLAVDLMLLESGRDLGQAADLAIAGRDLKREVKFVSATVHSVGAKDAGQVWVRLDELGGKGWRQVSRVRLKATARPAGLAASRGKVRLPVAGAAAGAPLRISVDPTDELPEICEANNRAMVP